jgi:2-C-methyl-D-erythritol 4-phosphate cytidylyltransferase
MKRATRDRKIESTVSRDDLWHAQTPQMFRYSMLKSALENVFAKNIPVTDESQAIEMFGKFPMLVEGHADNIKITHPADLKLAEVYLKQQENHL